MKYAVFFLPLILLAACETGGGHSRAAGPEPAQPGITISGTARVGVSTSF